MRLPVPTVAVSIFQDKVHEVIGRFLTSEFGAVLKRYSADILACFTLVVITWVYSVKVVDFSIPPFEDAAILMRYADHFADGKGMVWNTGEAPVDGATDFLFMLSVGVLHSTGLSLELTVRLLTILSHYLTILLIFVGMRYYFKAGIPASFGSALYFAVGPGLFFSAAFFGTPVFVFAIAATWFASYRITIGKNHYSDYILFSTSALITGLVRPEGVIVGSLLLVSVLPTLNLKNARSLFAVFMITFSIFGGLYFFWRWWYFGYPLPNPFYKKGGGRLYFVSLDKAFLYFRITFLPILPALLLSLRNIRYVKRMFRLLIPPIGATAMWVFLSDEMNFGNRFQYPVLLFAVLIWYPLVDDITLPPLFRMKNLKQFVQITAYILCFAFFEVPLFQKHVNRSRQITYHHDGRYVVAKKLELYARYGYTMAVTEAGLLPLYSTWRAIDTWGLNDKWIAHNGGVSSEYLDRQKPDLVMWHGAVFPDTSDTVPKTLWDRQTAELFKYVNKNEFYPAAVFGTSPRNAHLYYVKKTLPHYSSIVNDIGNSVYVWWQNGAVCRNNADGIR